jgi:hypothetical protein
MRRFLIWTIVMAMITSLQNTMALGVVSATAVAHGATPNAHIHAATTKTKRKIRLKSNLALAPVDPEREAVVDDDITLARNRNKIQIIDEQEEELSDYIKIRLMLARMKAMKAYSMASLSKSSG